MSKPENQFDIDFFLEYATDAGFRCSRDDENHATVHFAEGFDLCFGNMPEEDDVIIYFGGVEQYWHTHSPIIQEEDGEFPLVPVNVLSQLIDGRLFIQKIEFWPEGIEVALVQPAAYPGELDQMEPGERITFIRISLPGPRD